MARAGREQGKGARSEAAAVEERDDRVVHDQPEPRHGGQSRREVEVVKPREARDDHVLRIPRDGGHAPDVGGGREREEERHGVEAEGGRHVEHERREHEADDVVDEDGCEHAR